MIIKYSEFINENNVLKPEDFGITKYEWVNGYLDCFQDVDINGKNLTKLPFPFGKIYGIFDCEKNKLTNLENCPQYVDSHFDCACNLLTNLDGCPKIVDGDFYCMENKLSSIEDYPLCIVTSHVSRILMFEEVFEIVKNNKELFEPLLNDKVKFHQMVMRLDPSLIQYYTTIQPPSKKTFLFDI